MPIVLIIEDAPTNMQLAMAILKIAGHTAAFAFDAEHGLEIARQDPIDLILMDMRLPGMDGLTATRHLKDDPRTRDIPVIALTASAMDGDEQRMLAAGCCEYVAKPIRYRELLEVIDKTLARHNARHLS